MFDKAIVRTPCKAIDNGITTANLGTPDYNTALKQHDGYIRALQQCGLDVSILAAEEEFPDSTFVEDVALLTPSCAILCNPGAASRAGEVSSIRATIESFYSNVHTITSPGTIEAGDIMMVDQHYYIGLSQRTNKAGAEQMIAILEEYGMTGSSVPLQEVLHLKTGLGYLQEQNLLACGEFLQTPDFRKYHLLEVDTEEAYAANSVWINGTVLTPEGFPKTRRLIESAGYNVLEVDVSEFQKIDGGLSCLSLRF